MVELDGDDCTEKRSMSGSASLAKKVLWYVPKQSRGKLDARWRYGVFIGRSMNSDQNFVSLQDGYVVKARAIVRVIPEVRWDAQRIQNITMTPLDERARSGTLDAIEEAEEPHAHAEDISVPSASVSRVKIMPKDLVKYGTSPRCPKCAMVNIGDKVRARYHNHTEACRARIYRALRADGSLKIRLADPTRTQSKDEPPTVAHTPTPAPVTPPSNPDSDPNLDDTTNFFQEVNEDAEQVQNANALIHRVEQIDTEHAMVVLMDVLQTLGVAPRVCQQVCLHDRQR